MHYRLWVVLLISFVTLLMTEISFAYPKEIIIIRHGDKLVQNNPGPALSPKGVIRAMAFGRYYIEKYKMADYIIATDPAGTLSTREIETVAPLSNMLTVLHPDQDFSIYHKYTNDEYTQLANELLNDKSSSSHYDGKMIVICWDHGRIPGLVAALGVKQSLPDWPDTAFDTVYDIQYPKKGKPTLQILVDQYPVIQADNLSWEALYRRVTNEMIGSQ